MDLDDLQEKTGGLSKLQLWVLCGACSAVFAFSFTGQSAVIFSAVLPHRCSVPPIDDAKIYPSLNEDDVKNLTIPLEDNEHEYSSCYRYDYNLSSCTGDEDYSCITDPNEVGIIKCDKGWHYDDTYYDESTISQWDLVCDRKTLDSMANSMYFFGYFIGSFSFGPISDWFGRKRACLGYSAGVVITNFITAFIPGFPLYVFFRILVAIMTVCCWLSVYTYITEIMTYKTRLLAGFYSNIVVSIGHVLVPWTAYLLRNWRYVSIFNSIIMLPYFIIYFFIPYSPSVGRSGEAREFVSKCAESNNTKVNDGDWEEVVKTEYEKIKLSGVGKRYTIVDLFRRPMTRILSLNVAYCWFVVSMVYFGLTLNGGNLAGNPYVNTTLNALAEVFAHIAYYFTGSLGRVRMLSFAYGGSGVCCLMSMTFNLVADGDDESGFSRTSVAFAILGKFFASWVFDLVYSVAAESYPTTVRATGLSLGSMAARIGGMITPFTLQLQYKVPWVTQAIFGILSLIACLTCLLFPETKDAEFITTLEEAEHFYMANMKKARIIFRIKPPKDANKGRSNPAFDLPGKADCKETKF